MLFNQWTKTQMNPNAELESGIDGLGHREVILKRNRGNAYVASGTINYHPVVFMVNMQAKFTIKGVGGIIEKLVDFCAVGLALHAVHQDARPLDFLRLVRMEHGNRVKRAHQGPGLLACHQGHIGLGRVGSQHKRCEEHQAQGPRAT
jgi:hypothetical protein